MRILSDYHANMTATQQCHVLQFATSAGFSETDFDEGVLALMLGLRVLKGSQVQVEIGYLQSSVFVSNLEQ